jgi:hypothetical protein
MLNLTLFYFFLLGIYHCGKKYLPKIQSFLERFHRLLRTHPLIVLFFVSSAFVVSQPHQGVDTQEFMTSILQVRDSTSLQFANTDDEMKVYPIILKLLTLL